MERLGVAVSIIAVIAIALQSTKAVYATVNGTKNCSKEVNDLKSTVLLPRLSTFPIYVLQQEAKINNRFHDIDRTDLSGLRRAMEECAQILADFRNQVKNLGVLPMRES